jgi:hypothetical protein
LVRQGIVHGPEGFEAVRGVVVRKNFGIAAPEYDPIKRRVGILMAQMVLEFKLEATAWCAMISTFVQNVDNVRGHSDKPEQMLRKHSLALIAIELHPFNAVGS